MTENKKCWCGGQVGSTEAFATGSSPLVCLDSKFHKWDASGRPEKIRRIYVAGPMSGYPDCNYPAFHTATEALEEAGFEIVNPADFGEGEHYVDFIREDLRLMLDCDAVATLDKWWESTGARNEVQVAGILMMPVRTVNEWLDMTAISNWVLDAQGLPALDLLCRHHNESEDCQECRDDAAYDAGDNGDAIRDGEAP